MGMHDPASDEYRPYKPNSAAPIPAPVIQSVDLAAAIDAGDMEPASIHEPEGDATWAIKATEHVEDVIEATDDAATPEGDDLPGYEAPAIDHSDDPDPMQPYGDPEQDSEASDDHDSAAVCPDGTTVGDLPDENGATVDDHCDDGFIPLDGESDAEAHTRFHAERGDEPDGHEHG